MTPNDSRRATGSLRHIVEKDLSHVIMGCAFEVHNELGHGFSEAVYCRSLAVALQQRGVSVQREVPIRVQFRGVEVGLHRLDLLVEDRVVVEVKSLERIPDPARKQVRSYLAASRKELGLIINFGPRVDYYRVLRPA